MSDSEKAKREFETAEAATKWEWLKPKEYECEEPEAIRNLPDPAASEKQQETANRLGEVYGNSDVDDENVPVFAKVSRIIGLALVSVVVTVLMSSDRRSWNFRDTVIFEFFDDKMGLRTNSAGWSAIFTLALIVVLGWRYRFQIGTLISTVVIGLFSWLFRKI